jgi:hypothetical protein
MQLLTWYGNKARLPRQDLATNRHELRPLGIRTLGLLGCCETSEALWRCKNKRSGRLIYRFITPCDLGWLKAAIENAYATSSNVFADFGLVPMT